ncbi:FISUMP domain-containing protein [uncultured Fibrobacter sp.]|uniref:FISUMP domain-containing protein n=1 Tax=uncultured Fibrobacter sp. TaxID=261512 RepID=UPI0025F6492A|nr:FISUMP domain-containing protein [uncultured Fibrobacter sp.]
MKRFILFSIPLLVAACADVAGNYEEEYGDEYAGTESATSHATLSSAGHSAPDYGISSSSNPRSSSVAAHSSSSIYSPSSSAAIQSSSSAYSSSSSATIQSSSSAYSSSSSVPVRSSSSVYSSSSSIPVRSSSSAYSSSSSVNVVTCGGEVYNPSTHFCEGNDTHPLCGGQSYTYAEEFCFGQSVYPKCSGETYDPTTNLCVGGILKDLCGTQTYTPGDDVECKDGILYNMFTDSRDGKKYRYVTIGSYTVMAENLNYSDSVATPNLEATSSCYKNDPSNCAKYGRLYGWPAAVDLPHSYVADKYNITGTHQGICPSGWHVPTQSEILDIDKYAKDRNSTDPYNDLKSKTGWKTAGTNLYGFSAEPGGDYNMSIGHYQINELVGFWTTTEYASGSAMYYRISNSGTSSDLTTKWDQYYIRCFKN